MKTRLIKMVLAATMAIAAITFCPVPQGSLPSDPMSKKILIPGTPSPIIKSKL